jgi:Fe-S-cluster containining protein
VQNPGTATAHIALNVGGRPLRVSLEVPNGATRVRTMLPVFRQVANAVVDVGVRQAEAQGERVSCRKGCGACCRQLVPITVAEAHALHELIETLPAGRRATILGRFAEARRVLDEAGLLRRLHDRPPDSARALGLEYFRLGIPCPFLEDEACSIHADRPIACREYLVTSPAEHCASPSAESVRMVRLSGSASRALSRLEGPDARGRSWVPLVLTPECAADQKEAPAREGRVLLEEFFRHLTSAARQPPRE